MNEWMNEINIIQFNIILIEYLFAYTINVANVYKIDLKNHHYILVDMTDVATDSAGIVDNVDSTDDMIQTPWKDMEQMVATFKIQANQMSQQFRLLQKTTQKQIAQLKKEAGKPKTKSKVANTVLGTFGFIKFPMPTIEFNQSSGTRFYGVYF